MRIRLDLLCTKLLFMHSIKWSFLFAALLVVGAASAQNTKLFGTWKATKMEAEGTQFDLIDAASLERAIYLVDLKKEPKKVFTSTDSTTAKFAAGMIQAMFERMTFEFKTNNTYAINMEVTMFGMTKSETVDGNYKVSGNKIEFVEKYEKEDKDKKELIEFQLADPNTLIFKDFKGAKGMSIVLKRG